MDLRARNNVQIEGDGPTTLVFAHGFGCDLHMWRLLAPVYAKRFRTLCFDHVGSGGSDLSAYAPRSTRRCRATPMTSTSSSASSRPVRSCSSATRSAR